MTTPGTWLAWTAGSRRDAEDTAKAAAEQHGLERAEVRIRPSWCGQGFEIWTADA